MIDYYGRIYTHIYTTVLHVETTILEST